MVPARWGRQIDSSAPARPPLLSHGRHPGPKTFLCLSWPQCLHDWFWDGDPLKCCSPQIIKRNRSRRAPWQNFHLLSPLWSAVSPFHHVVGSEDRRAVWDVSKQPSAVWRCLKAAQCGDVGHSLSDRVAQWCNSWETRDWKSTLSDTQYIPSSQEWPDWW